MSATLLAGILVAAQPPAPAAPLPAPPAPVPLTTPTQVQPIIGGALSEDGAWTSVVGIVHWSSLHPNSSLATVDLCTGVMLDKRTILTAAHCLIEIDDVENMRVVFGNQLDAEDERFVATVDEVFVHPDYCTDDDCGADAYDFGLVTIVENVGGIEFFEPLVDQTEWDDSMMPGDQVTVVGFGAVREVQEEDPPLEEGEIGLKREVSIQVQRLSPTGHEFIAGNEGMDVCGGDSGGPAFVQLADGSWRISGIVSRGVIPCGVGEGYYGTVYAALPWIRESVGLDYFPDGCDGVEGDTCLDTRPPSSGTGCRVEPVEPRAPVALGLALLGLFTIARRRRNG